MEIVFVETTADHSMKLKILQAIDRPISNMSLSGLCSNCGISKRTFYKHFDSKYSVGLWYSHFCCEQFLYQVGRKYTWSNALAAHFKLLSRESERLRNSVTDELRSQLAKGQARELEFSLRNTFIEKKAPLSDEMAFYISTCSLIIVEKTSSHLLTEPELISSGNFASWIENCIPLPLRTAMDAMVS